MSGVTDLWARIYDRTGERHAWSAEDVRLRLEEAVTVIEATGGRVGPDGYGSNWPEMRREWEDYVAEVQSGEEKPHDRPPPRRATTTAEITRAGATIRWQALYLDGRERKPVREALKLWLACKAKRAPFRRQCRLRGLVYPTIKRRCGLAFYVIAIGLMRDNVRLDDEALERKANPEFAPIAMDEDDEDHDEQEAA